MTSFGTIAPSPVASSALCGDGQLRGPPDWMGAEMAGLSVVVLPAVAMIWIIAGAAKAAALERTRLEAEELVNRAIPPPVWLAFAGGEVAVGLMIAAGPLTFAQVGLGLSMILLAAFAILLWWSRRRGIRRCACFGVVGAGANDGRHIAADIGLAALSATLIVAAPDRSVPFALASLGLVAAASVAVAAARLGHSFLVAGRDLRA